MNNNVNKLHVNLREKRGANWNQENVLEYFFWIYGGQGLKR